MGPSWTAILPGLYKVNMVIHFHKLLNSSVGDQMVIYLQVQKHVMSGKTVIWKSKFTLRWIVQSVQFSSVAQSCPTLCDPMNRSTPGLCVHHQLPEFAQTHVHRVSDAIQPSHQVAKGLELQLQHQSFQWTFRTDFLLDGLVGSPCSPRDSQEF